MKGSVLVTGASRGIGAAIAQFLADAGYVVGCLSRSGAPPNRPAAPSATRERWFPIRADVTDEGAVRRAVKQLAEYSGPLAGVVNNAGVHDEARSADMTREQWDAAVSTNVLSTVFGCQAAYPYLVAAGGGLIVNIGSFFDKLGVKRNLAYCASKAAVGAVTRVLAVEWASDRIRVLNVAPGYIVTDLNREAMTQGPLRAYLERRIPQGGPGTADDIAVLVTALFTAGHSFLTGETIYVDGGQGIAH